MSNQKIIDVRTITDDGPAIHFVATETERKDIAERFDISRLDKFEVTGCFGRDSVEGLITFDGELETVAERECVVTLHLFSEKVSTPLHLLFSDQSIEDNADPKIDIIPIYKGRIDLLNVFSEEFGLTLNPFPRSVDEYLDYHDPDDRPDENPFDVLKNLK